jgi:hypothetical protein
VLLVIFNGANGFLIYDLCDLPASTSTRFILHNRYFFAQPVTINLSSFIWLIGYIDHFYDDAAMFESLFSLLFPTSYEVRLSLDFFLAASFTKVYTVICYYFLTSAMELPFIYF